MIENNKNITAIQRRKVVKKIEINKHFSVSFYENYEHSMGTPLVVGFADIGITPIMVTGFLLDQLQLPLIGAIKSSSLAPSAVVSHSQPSFPMRIYGNNRVTVVTSENKISAEKTPKLSNQLVKVVLGIARALKSKSMWCTEGVPTDKVDISRTIQFLSTDNQIAEKLSELGHSPLNAALISGITGGLLAECSEYEESDDDYIPDVSVLLSPTASQYPDALTSVTLLKVLQMFILSGDDSESSLEACDTSKLEKNAKEIENKVKEIISPSSNDHGASSMYM